MKTDIFEDMAGALRAELQEYGGMLGLLDEQQKAILRGEPQAFVDLGAALHEQISLLGAHRSTREKTVRTFGQSVKQPESATLSELLPYMPAPSAGMIKALIEEINALIDRTQRRLRQNHLLLARCVSGAQQAVARASGSEMVSAYGPAGAVKCMLTPSTSHLAIA
jgi:hypothetical protein